MEELFRAFQSFAINMLRTDFIEWKEGVYLRVSPSGRGHIVDSRNQILHRYDHSEQMYLPITWQSRDEGIEMLVDCKEVMTSEYQPFEWR